MRNSGTAEIVLGTVLLLVGVIGLIESYRSRVTDLPVPVASVKCTSDGPVAFRTCPATAWK